MSGGRIGIYFGVLAWTVFTSLPQSALAGEKRAEYSLLLKSFAPNAGGQDAVSLRAGRDDFEVAISANNFVLVDGFAMVGASYSKRFPICGRNCWIARSYAGVGIGISQLGPYSELSASFVPLSVIRIDIATWFFPQRDRIISWSYPLWCGVTLPVDLPFFW